MELNKVLLGAAWGHPVLNSSAQDALKVSVSPEQEAVWTPESPRGVFSRDSDVAPVCLESLVWVAQSRRDSGKSGFIH